MNSVSWMTYIASSSPSAKFAIRANTWLIPLDRQRLPAQGSLGAVPGVHRQGGVGFSHHADVDRRHPYRPTLRRLCGWETLAEVPSEATFSRAFAVFATDGLPQIIHMAMVKQHLADKLVGHISRDATAIHAREKAAKKDAQPVPQPDETQEPLTPEPTRLQRQLERGLDENLADLPRACDWGTKKDSKGKKLCWRGYKLHIDVIDGDLPISWLLTSASLHDSQAAIPLAQMSGQRVTSLYDLADAAYDAAAIREMSARLGHVAIIDHNPRRGEKQELAPAQAVRYHQRSSSERVNSHLHDNHGGRHVRRARRDQSGGTLIFWIVGHRRRTTAGHGVLSSDAEGSCRWQVPAAVRPRAELIPGWG